MVPKRIILPLNQHTGKPAKPMVKAQDYVEVGALVAGPAGFISSSIHSSVSGTVKEITEAPHPVIGRFSSIIIESDGQQKISASVKLKPQALPLDILKLKPQEIIDHISDAGVVGMGGGGFPTGAKLCPPKDKIINTLIINGAECEPFLTCDYRLMLERPQDIISGALIIARALGVKNCIIAIEDNKPEAVVALEHSLSTCHSFALLRTASEGAKRPKNLKERFFGCLRQPQNDTGGAIRIAVVPTKYPQGAEKQLIKTLTGREVSSGGLPFEVGVVVYNVATSLAAYEAVVLNKPLYERVITVSGDCIKEPSNLLVKIGTPASDLAAQCGGFIKGPVEVIFGGPMMGIAQWSLDTPVLKGTGGVLFLSKDAAFMQDEGVCIRCGRCVFACPIGLEPTGIYHSASMGKFELAGEYNAADCIECGLCSFQCPAKLDLTGLIKYAKHSMLKRQ